jgi:hypothetical protein
MASLSGLPFQFLMALALLGSLSGPILFFAGWLLASHQSLLEWTAVQGTAR